jgi:hypothetical protein
MCNIHRFAPPGVLGAARRLAERILAVHLEFRDAQRRMLELRTSPDTYLMRPNVPPDTYEEFLARTSGLLRHEPPARSRKPRR